MFGSMLENNNAIFVVCPFNISHLIMKSRLQYHINREHPEEAHRTAHHSFKSFQAHIATCPLWNNYEHLRISDISLPILQESRVPSLGMWNFESSDSACSCDKKNSYRFQCIYKNT